MLRLWRTWDIVITQSLSYYPPLTARIKLWFNPENEAGFANTKLAEHTSSQLHCSPGSCSASIARCEQQLAAPARKEPCWQMKLRIPALEQSFLKVITFRDYQRERPRRIRES